MSQAKKEFDSGKKYKDSVAATAPPKPSYTTSSGSTVNVRQDKHTEYIRSRPITSYTPAARSTALDSHVTVHHYNHPVSYYQAQPAFHVGGGYSPLFWYMMMDNWSESRRAEWLYHNQSHISQEAYERGMKDAAVAQKVAEMKLASVPVKDSYVDPEMEADPSLMFEEEYIESAYNPEVESATFTYEKPAPSIKRFHSETESSISFSDIAIALAATLGVIGLGWFVFFKRI